MKVDITVDFKEPIGNKRQWQFTIGLHKLLDDLGIIPAREPLIHYTFDAGEDIPSEPIKIRPDGTTDLLEKFERNEDDND